MASEAASLRDLFRAFSPRIQIGPLGDFGRHHRVEHARCEVVPSTIAQVAEIVGIARRHGVPVRVRGQGHSLNGTSLPAEGELLLLTDRLTTVCFTGPHEVVCGAGVRMWTVRSLLKAFSLSLPVVNDGFSGPTAGGYVCAGGFGPGSARYGGLWANVASVTVVTGGGDVVRVDRRHPDFPWLFGAMGQLGVVVEVSLDVVAASETPDDEEAGYLGTPQELPVGSQLDTAALQVGTPAASELAVAGSGTNSLYWFTLFVPEDDLTEVTGWLKAVQDENHDVMTYLDEYAYPITHRGLTAPLVYPWPASFVAVGSWGVLRDRSAARLCQLVAYDARFTDMARRPGYRRYVQSELPSTPDFYQSYFSTDVYGEFRRRRQRVDPDALINRNTVFAET